MMINGINFLNFSVEFSGIFWIFVGLVKFQ